MIEKEVGQEKKTSKERTTFSNEYTLLNKLLQGLVRPVDVGHAGEW